LLKNVEDYTRQIKAVYLPRNCAVFGPSHGSIAVRSGSGMLATRYWSIPMWLNIQARVRACVLVKCGRQCRRRCCVCVIQGSILYSRRRESQFDVAGPRWLGQAASLAYRITTKRVRNGLRHRSGSSGTCQYVGRLVRRPGAPPSQMLK